MSRKSSRHRTKTEWQNLLEQQQQSELTIEQFCHQHSLTQSSFYLWRKKLSDDGLQPITTPKLTQPEWTPITPPQDIALTPWDIELDLPNGVSLRVRLT